MRLFLYIILSLVGSCTLASTTIDFDPRRGIVEVDVVINGYIKGRFGIDTGADRVYIDRNFAKKNSIAIRSGPPERAVTGIDGQSEASRVELRLLEIGGERLHNLSVSAVDMSQFIKDDRNGIPDGLIGHDLLQRFYVTVDYPNGKLTLQMTEPAFLPKLKKYAIPFKQTRHFIIVDVTLNDSITVPMILDYCASHMFISKKLAKRLGAPESAEQLRVKNVSIGGKISTANVASVVTDYTEFRKRVRGAKFEGVLGASFFYRHKVTVGYRRNTIYIHPE